MKNVLSDEKVKGFLIVLFIGFLSGTLFGYVLFPQTHSEMSLQVSVENGSRIVGELELDEIPDGFDGRVMVDGVFIRGYEIRPSNVFENFENSVFYESGW